MKHIKYDFKKLKKGDEFCVRYFVIDRYDIVPYTVLEKDEKERKIVAYDLMGDCYEFYSNEFQDYVEKNI